MTEVIAIDGPAASGKSTTARLVAEALGFSYLDTGAMYRASALITVRSGADTGDHELIAGIIRRHSIDLSNGRVYVDGEDVSSLIRNDLMSETASLISSGTAVRREMVSLQRRFARDHDTVAEGRDMGTVVFPDADLKVYFVADIAVRAVRRWREMKAAGEGSRFHPLLVSMLHRDRRDRERADSPLRLGPGAVMLDSTFMSITGQVFEVLRLYRERVKCSR